MAVLFWLLADNDADRRVQLILGAFGIVAVVLIGIGIIALEKRWRNRPFRARMSASEQLAQFRESFEKGQISPEEFERIRALLNERIRQEMEVMAATPATPPDAKSPPTNGQGG